MAFMVYHRMDAGITKIWKISMRSFNVENTVSAGVNCPVEHAVAYGAVDVAARLVLDHAVVVCVVEMGERFTTGTFSMIILK